MTDRRTIVVGIDGSQGSEIAQRWAVDEARTRKQPLRLVCAFTWNTDLDSVPMYVYETGVGIKELKRITEATLRAALEQIKTIADVDVTSAAVEGGAVEVLLKEAGTASLVVVGSRQLHATGSFVLGSVGAHVAARATCPVVVTRGPAGYPAERSKVIAGVDATEQSEAVLGFAFAEASRHGVPLRAVLCWHPSIVKVRYWTEQGTERGRVQAEAWLAETMAGWQEKYPDVAVTTRVADEHPVSGLVEESLAEYLLVVGKSGRGATAGVLLGSVSQGVLHHAICPVAVIPTAGVGNAH
jgi:nucleotide-binding universal stress UspA family protein